MRAHTPDGGPAFPIVTPRPDQFKPGMSLRDWFAGMALAGGVYPADKDGDCAERCYRIADTMLAERAKASA